MRRILQIGAIAALIVCLLLSAIWANLAIAYQLPGSAGLRIAGFLSLALMAVAALAAVGRCWRWRAVLIYAAACLFVIGWTISINASNKKIWAAEVDHGITGTIDGD